MSLDTVPQRPSLSPSVSGALPSSRGDTGHPPVFISYVQSESRVAALELYYNFDRKVWLDVKRADVSVAGMMEGGACACTYVWLHLPGLLV